MKRALPFLCVLFWISQSGFAQQMVSIPPSPLSPKSAQQCSAYEKDVQRVRDIVDKWHQQCLDSFKGKGTNPAPNGCSQQACAKYHDADEMGESNVQKCYDDVRKYERAVQEEERRAAEAQRQYEEARQKAERDRIEAQQRRQQEDLLRNQQQREQAERNRQQILQAQQEALRRQQQFQQEQRRQQAEASEKIQKILESLQGQFGPRKPSMEGTLRDAFAKAGMDPATGLCITAECREAFSTFPKNMTADEFATWAESTRRHGWDNPTSLIICPECAGNFVGGDFGFEVRSGTTEKKNRDMEQAPDPARYVEPNLKYYRPIVEKDPNKLRNLTPGIANTYNAMDSVAGLVQKTAEWSLDFADGVSLEREIYARASTELSSIPVGSGALLVAVSDNKGMWNSFVGATGRTYDEALRIFNAVPRLLPGGSRTKYIWVGRLKGTPRPASPGRLP